MQMRFGLNKAARLAFVLLAIMLLVLVSLVAHPLSASASTKVTLYSTDHGAKGVFVITWNSSTAVTVDWTNYDVKKDSKGAYLHIDLDDCIGPDPRFTDHNGSGYNSFDGGVLKKSGCGHITALTLRECNGGDSSNCDVDYIDDPYYPGN